MPCTSPVTVNLRDGIHNFFVQVMGSSGAVVSDTRLWTVECVAPQGDASTFALFHMDEVVGSTLINTRPYQPAPPSRDATLGQGDGTHEPTRITPGRFGTGGIRFAGYAVGETDRVLMGILLDPPTSENIGEHSVEMWVNPAPSFPHDLYLWAVQPSPAEGRLTYRLMFRRNGTTGHFRLETQGADGVSRNIDSQAVDIGFYHHVIVTYTPGSAPALFVDGVATRVPEPVSGTFDLMADAFSRFEGDVDEFHLTFHPFTEGEVLERWCPP